MQHEMNLSASRHMSYRRLATLIVLAGCLCALLAPPAATQVRDEPETVPTFASIGIYWRTTGMSREACSVRFRENPGHGPTGAWRDGLDLWFDDRVGDNTSGYVGPSWRQLEYRGSIVGLAPGTRYEIELAIEGGPTATIIDTTWSETFPEAPTIHHMSAPFEVTVGGTPEAYEVYTMAGFVSEIAAPNVQHQHCVVVSAPYVIIRGLTLRGGHNGVFVIRDAHHVVIEDCDIADWGFPTTHSGETGWGDECAGIYVYDRWTSPASQPDTTGIRQVVIQRNRIHDPHYDSNNWCEYNEDNLPWDPCHPLGPLGIEIVNPWGNNVIRYNEIYSDNGNYFTDGIGGHGNYSYFGCPGRDSDIYGNWFSNIWDDAIETEGGNANVRVWGNYADQTLTGIACAATATGPLYIWRNVIDRSDKYDMETLDYIAGEDSCDCMGDFWGNPRPVVNAGRFLKTTTKTLEHSGTDYYWGSGRVYLLHNTVLQRANDPTDDDWNGDPWDRWPYKKIDQGVSAGLSTCRLSNFFVRNNLQQVVDQKWYALGFPSETATMDMGFELNDIDYEMLNGAMTIAEDSCTSSTTLADNGIHNPHGFYSRDTQDYMPDWGDLYLPARGEAGIFQLASGTPGHDDGDAIRNFNDGPQTIGTGPDMGAHEAGAAPMRFGVNAGDHGTAVHDGSIAVGPGIALAVSPNPAGAAVRVGFTISRALLGAAETTPVRLSIHDARGRRVAAIGKDALAAGPHTLVWDGHDDGGRRVGKGVYFFKLEIGGETTTGKVALLK